MINKINEKIYNFIFSVNENLKIGITEDNKILVANSGAKGKLDYPGINLVGSEDLEKAMLDDTIVSDMTWGQIIPVKEKYGYVVVG
jgi:hypothetical protein